MSIDSIKNNTAILPHFSLQKHLIEIISFYVLITLYKTISKYILFYLDSLSSSIFIELGFQRSFSWFENSWAKPQYYQTFPDYKVAFQFQLLLYGTELSIFNGVSSL